LRLNFTFIDAVKLVLVKTFQVFMCMHVAKTYVLLSFRAAEK